MCPGQCFQWPACLAFAPSPPCPPPLLPSLGPHRLHYGHPDMVDSFLIKQTAGVSRGSKKVNVNEDVFLGYEMLLMHKGITFLEFLSYGKGREVDFEGASVFLKKLAAGAAMQLRSRQVCADMSESGVVPSAK